MTTFIERRRSGGFILSEAPGHLSRDNGVLASGEVCEAGELLMLDTGKLIAWDGESAVAGVLLSWTDATVGDTPVSTVARLAEVNFDLLVYPDGSEDSVEAALDAIGIITHLAANIGAGGGGGGAYAAQAVHFNPGGSFQTLFDGLIGVPGNYDCGLFSCWVANISVADPGDVLVYIADDINAGFNINQNQASDFLVVSYDDPAGNRALAAEDDTFLLPIIGWKHLIVSAQKSTETLQCLVNGSPLGFALEPPIWGPGTGFGNSSGDTWSIIFTTAEVDFADLYFRLSNTFFDLTDPTNFAKFNVEGKPADPTGFPSGSWLTLTNGADGWTSTAASLGLTTAGTLTNASTSPSD